MNREDMLRRLGEGEDALELSIEKWQDIVDGKGVDNGHYNCALCRTYDVANTKTKCGGCPLFDGFKVGEPCSRYYYQYTRNSTTENAQIMLDTLISLRPEPKREFKPVTIEIHLGWNFGEPYVDIYDHQKQEQKVHINADKTTIVKIINKE